MTQLLDFIGSLLAFFYDLWPSYGGAIILLTMSVMIVTTPLTLKGTRSMMAMQRLQPEMKRIQERYKDDREKLNEEMLAFYRENNISPVGGCLPLLLQMPVFVVLFGVLRGLTRPVATAGIQLGWTIGQIGKGVALTVAPSAVTKQPFDPAYVPHNSSLYQSLAGSTQMDWLGIDLSESASRALSQGLIHALPYFLLIAIVGVSGWLQQYQVQSRTGPQNQQQQMMARVMVLFLPLISFGMPAGLVLYFAVSNLYRVGIQWYITRSYFADEDAAITTTAKEKGAAKSTPKGGAAKGEVQKGGPLAALTRGLKGNGATSKSSEKPATGGKKTGSTGGAGQGRSGARSSRSSAKRKTFTSDPRDRQKRADQAPAQPASPRPRKKKKRK